MADLAKTLFIEKVRSMCASRRSGVLVATHGDVSKGVFIRAGRIVFASSTVEKEKLGENLVRLGRISRAEFVAAYQSAASSGSKRRLGQALVGAGLITEEELSKLVAVQVQKIVISALAWTQGSTRFHESAEPIPEDLALDISTHRLLLEGARVFPDADRLEKALGSFDRVLKLSSHPPFDFATMAFSPAEREAMNGAADGLALHQIVANSSLARPLLVRALYALLVGGILEEGAQPKRAYEGDTGTFRLALPGGATPQPDGGPRERILRLYESIPRATHYELMDVPPDASAADIEAAFTRLTREEREWQPLHHDARLGSLIGTLRLRRRQAYQTLSDAQKRKAYDRSLSEMKPSRQHVASPEEHGQAARLTREAQKHLEKGDRDRAVTLLLEAVRVDPQDRGCRRLLALALAEDASLSRAAERHFLAALDMDPGDVELRYRLALYYKHAGLVDRAAAELKTVLAADPRHSAAARALRALGAV